MGAYPTERNNIMSDTDDTIIKGFSLDITAEDLKKITAGRAEHHGSRAKVYREEAARLAKLKQDDDERLSIINKSGSSGDPVKSCEESATRHERKARFFKFASEHFAVGATYRLSAQDLQYLEVAPDRY